MTIYIIHYGPGGELDRCAVKSEDKIAEALADMGPWRDGDTIKIVKAAERAAEGA
jgi:hypothetical protein